MPTKIKRARGATPRARPPARRAPRSRARARRPVAPPPIPTPKAARVARLNIVFRPAPGAKTEVLIGSGLIPAAADGLLRARASVLVVIDAGLPRALAEPLLRTLDLAGARWGVRVVTAQESNKSLDTLAGILGEAAALRMERGDVLVGVGGGIACDLSGLAAGLYRRGVRHVLCPTSLLAMIDASIGGKTAANLTIAGEDHRPRLLKNMVGMFHQPARVVVDVAALSSLPARHLRAGLAEAVKHGLIGGGAGDARLLEFTGRRLEAIVAREPRAVAELVTRNIRLKARVVAADEREAGGGAGGGRVLLNLGHTFAHVLETLAGLSWRPTARAGAHEGGHADGAAPRLREAEQGLLHGEAVGLGLLAACTLGERLGTSAGSLRATVHDLLTRIGLPTGVLGLPPTGVIVERLMDDKKTAGGRLRMVVPRRGLRAGVVLDPPAAALAGAIDALRGE